MDQNSPDFSIKTSRGFFSIGDVVYPNGTGLVAPGNEVMLTVLFRAASAADYDDELIIITEESSYSLPLKARRRQPALTLPPVLNCRACWRGEKSLTAIRVFNKGGPAAFTIVTPETNLEKVEFLTLSIPFLHSLICFISFDFCQLQQALRTRMKMPKMTE